MDQKNIFYSLQGRISERCHLSFNFAQILSSLQDLTWENQVGSIDSSFVIVSHAIFSQLVFWLNLMGCLNHMARHVKNSASVNFALLVRAQVKGYHSYEASINKDQNFSWTFRPTTIVLVQGHNFTNYARSCNSIG